MQEVHQPSDLASLSPSPALYGVIGRPVAHSLSPAMQEAGFAALGIDARYIRVEIPENDLGSSIATMRRLPFAGWNITLPHKIAMAGLVDNKAESATLSGTVNTVLNENGKLTGFSTDGEGWVRAVREAFGLDVRDLRILILGSGGVGQALARQCALEHCERLVLTNRSAEKAAALAEELAPRFHSTRLLGAGERLKVIPWDEEAIGAELNTIDLVVNGTSLGLKPGDPPVLPARILQPHLCVYDTIYRPARTRLLEAAAEAGARTANGLGMLLHQGALSLEIWTGKTAPIGAMKKALEQAAASAA